MPLEFLHTGRPLEESVLCVAEANLGYRLPDDYRAWLARHNGGRPRPGWLHLGKQRKPVTVGWHRVDELYELDNPAPLAVSAMQMRRTLREDYHPHPVLPRRFLPIGAVDDELMLLLSLAEPDAGCIYLWGLFPDQYWEIDYDEQGEPKDTELRRIADSFAEFLERLTEPPPEVLAEFDEESGADDAETALDEWLDQLPAANQEEARLHLLMASGTADAARQAMDEGLAPERVLMLAEMFGHRDMADAARERLGDKPVWPAAEAVMAAFWSDPAAVRRRLEEGAPAGGPTPDDSTPLHGAAAAGCIASMRLLLDAGADPSARDANGKTPLHSAAAGPERTEAVSFLLEHGAPIGVFDHEGELALHKAAGLSGSVETMKRLIDAGEDLHARAGFSRGPTLTEQTSELMRQSLAELASLGNPFAPPPESEVDDPEMREIFQQLANSPIAQMARRIAADPDAFLQQHQLQANQGRTAAEVLQMRLVPVGERFVPGTEIAEELDAYQRQQRSEQAPDGSSR